MRKKTNVLLASAIAASVLMMGVQSASAAEKAGASAIEQRLKSMEDQMNAMRGELARVRAESASAAKVSDLEAKVAKQASSGSASGKKKNMVFFRGGYADMKRNRGDLQTAGDIGENLGLGDRAGRSEHNANGNGWYVGAGFDFNLSDNLFGLSNLAEVDAELMFDYKDFGTAYNSLTQLTVAGFAANKAQVTMLSLSASPKIKFMPGSKFRPWIIPAGLGIHVISPPSNGVTVLNPGLMMGVGADYQILDNIYAGADFRYNFTGGALNYKDNHGRGLDGNVNKALPGVNTDGYTTGIYLGLGF